MQKHFEGVGIYSNALRWCAIAVTAVSIAVTANIAHASAAPEPTPIVAVSLPEPTGDLPVGVTDVHLIDRNRIDPWNHNRRRELMVRIWYPATDSDLTPIAPWTTPGGLQLLTSDLTDQGIPSSTWALAPSHSRQDARARTADGPFPILLFSPGMDDPAGLNTAQAEDLASHGYIVATINHTYEAFAVQFPDGHTERTVIPLDSPPEVLSDVLLPVRVADTEFVVDQLADIASRHSMSSDHRGTVDLAGILDLSKIGMFGHSLGGTTTAQAMHDDPRIRAGVNLDGPPVGVRRHRRTGSAVADARQRQPSLAQPGKLGTLLAPQHRREASSTAIGHRTHVLQRRTTDPAPALRCRSVAADHHRINRR
ncbi:alpha/beta hydrolase family protein [Nocardia brasiliensis]